MRGISTPKLLDHCILLEYFLALCHCWWLSHMWSCCSTLTSCASVTLWFCIASESITAGFFLFWMSACVVEGERWRDCEEQSEPVSWWGLTWELFLCEPGRDHYCNEGSMAATLAGPRAALSSWSSAMWITLIKALLHSTAIFFKSSEITVTYLRRHAPPHGLLSPTVLQCQTTAENTLMQTQSRESLTQEWNDSNTQYENRTVPMSSYWLMWRINKYLYIYRAAALPSIYPVYF